MASLTLDTTVGRLVAERPSRARALDRLGIDYCRGGRMPLAQACAEKGLDVKAVLRAIDVPDFEAETVDWMPASPAALADMVVSTHHAYLRRELPRLAGLLDKVAAGQGSNHPELEELRGVFSTLHSRLNSDMNQEESIVFPLIRRLETAASAADLAGALADLIPAVEHAHDRAGAALARMRTLTGGYSPPVDACACYRVLLAGLSELETDMHSHAYKENHILFPQSLAAEAALRAGRLP